MTIFIKKYAAKIPFMRYLYHRLNCLINKMVYPIERRKNVREQFALLKGQEVREETRFELCWRGRRIFYEQNSASFDRHYVYHTAWAARKIAEISPDKHVDISSCLWFVSLVSAFIPIDFYDFNPPKLNISGVNVGFADLLKLPFADNSIKSLSCMHVVEHIGLGRYGDPVDYNGDLKSIAELKRVLAPQGNLLFVVPVGGNAEIIFNAHRVYTYQQVITMFMDLKLIEFSLICDNGSFVVNATPYLASQQKYGCGCFRFEK